MVTDHKPLTYIFGRKATTNKQLTPRLERWAMRLQGYDFTLSYEPGCDNPADYFSRHPIKENTTKQQTAFTEAEQHIQYVVDMSVPKAMTLEEVQQATTEDTVLKAVREAIETNRWYDARIKHDIPLNGLYKILMNIREELTTSKGVVLKGSRIVLPDSLQQKAIDIAHQGHQGIVKTVALMREKVWFRGMTKAVEEKVKNCHECQVSTPSFQREPLNMSPLPEAPWVELSADFAQLDSNTYILVVQDEYSRYIVTEIVHSTAGMAVIPRLDRIFSEFGIPISLKTDNGPPFNSVEFSNYLKHMGTKHRKITPRWPRANGETERFMRTLKKIITTKPRNWKQEMNKLLLSYRTTPHCTTGVAPATLLFGRNLNTKLPSIIQKPQQDSEIRETDSIAKQKMKKYADSKRYVKESDIKFGDDVLVKSDKHGTYYYDENPLTVIERRGNMIIAERGNQKITRNVSQFKKYNKSDNSNNSESELIPIERFEHSENEPVSVDISEPAIFQDTTEPGVQHDEPKPKTPSVPNDKTGQRPKRISKLPAKYKDFIVNP